MSDLEIRLSLHLPSCIAEACLCVMHSLNTSRACTVMALNCSALPCREGDFGRQQQTALKLHKLGSASGQHQYLWWAVTILVLQARVATEPGGRMVEETLAGLFSCRTSHVPFQQKLPVYKHGSREGPVWE